MMRVYLDGALLDHAGDSLASALDAVRTSAGHRLVIDLLADGRPVPAEHLDTPPATTPYAHELRATTADPRLLAYEALHEVADLLRVGNTSATQAAELIQSGKTEQAMSSLTQALTPWEATNQTVNLCLQLPVVGEATKRLGVDQAAIELARRLSEIKSALERSDWPTLSDVLAYDMPELTKQWTTLLTTLARELKP